MSDRARILEALRAAAGEAPPHPGRYTPPPTPAEWGRFAQVLASVGGMAIGPVSPAALGACVAEQCREWDVSGRIAAERAAIALLGPGRWEEIEPDASPHGLADVEVAVVRGSLGVAESGTVAIEGRDAPVRALAFLCERAVLLLDADRVFADLHTATRALPPDVTRAHHLTWVSGPSKTADIEQTLVLGAHGPRALAVVGYRAG